MRILLFWLLVCVLTSPAVAATPLPGSQLPFEQNMCAQCHGDQLLWQGDKSKFHVSAETLAEDVHWNKGVVCHDCHGGDPSGKEFSTTHRKEDGFRATAAEIGESCARCHRETMIDVTRKSVHAKAGERNPRGEGTPLDCNACHGTVQHSLVSLQNPASPLYLANQAKTCGVCHAKELATHLASLHGKPAVASDAQPTATCKDCHGAHGIYRTADNRSTLHESNVGSTCGKCHAGIQEQLSVSVHGAQLAEARADDQPTVLKIENRKPVCTSCHQRHEPPLAEAPPLLSEAEHQNGCGNCHSKLSGVKILAHHSELTAAGPVSAADCADCHGAHAIPPLDDATSPLSPTNRIATCQKCHPNAVANFAAFNPHAHYKDAKHFPTLHGVHAWIGGIVLVGLLFFVLHTVLWIFRATIHLLIHGPAPRNRAGQAAIVRFSPTHRLFRLVLILSILGLAITGLILRYSAQEWTQMIASRIGGYRVLQTAHLICGIFMFGCTFTYLGWLVRVFQQSRSSFGWQALLGPDSPLPNRQDLRDLYGMFRWFFGLGEKPKFDRWTFWEKFDYWAIVVIVVVIGGTGMVLSWPNLSARLLPGSMLNLSQMIHHETAMMITSFVLAIRYVNTHFRPEKFPLDLSTLTGLMSEDHLRRARPKFLERLQVQGKLDALRRTMPARRTLIWYAIGAGVVQIVGLIVVVATLVASLEG